MNRVTIMGRVGKEPEIRTFQNGDKVANFSIATSEKWTDKSSGEKKEKTEWHNIAITGPAVGVIEKYVHKGDQILVEGSLQTRKWQDQSGADKYATEVAVKAFGGAVHLIGGNKGGGDQGEPQSGGQQQNPGKRSDMDDEIPF